MSARFRLRHVGWAALAAAALGGCAGGATHMSPPLSPQSAVSASKAGPWPPAGASFTYAGTLKQTSIAGSATTHLTLGVTQHIRTVAATYAHRSVAEYEGTETATGSGTNVRTTFDAYVAEIASTIRAGKDVELLKATSSDSSGTHQTTIYGAGNGLFDQVPEVPQARWNNTATRTESIADSTSSLTDTYAADGSYDESAAFTGGAAATLQSYADGNAVYQWPLPNTPQNSTITFSPPSAGYVQVDFTNATGFPITRVVNIAVWYPALPLVLASDAFRDLGRAGIPAACKVPKSYGTTATELVETNTRLDIVFGEYETLQRTAYVTPPYGLVCIDLHDDLQTHYDYTTVTLSTKPLSEIVTDEVLGLRQAHVPNQAESLDGSVAIPLDVRIDEWRAANRLKTARAMLDALRNMRKTR